MQLKNPEVDTESQSSPLALRLLGGPCLLVKDRFCEIAAICCRFITTNGFVLSRVVSVRAEPSFLMRSFEQTPLSAYRVGLASPDTPNKIFLNPNNIVMYFCVKVSKPLSGWLVPTYSPPTDLDYSLRMQFTRNTPQAHPQRNGLDWLTTRSTALRKFQRTPGHVQH